MALPVPEYRLHADLLAWHEQLEVPQGYRAEVIDGGISVVPGPSGRHESVCVELRDRLRPVRESGLVAAGSVTLELPARASDTSLTYSSCPEQLSTPRNGSSLRTASNSSAR